MFHIAIIEDDLNMIKQLKGYAERYEKDNSEKLVVDCFDNPVLFLEHETSVYDIVFLDIKMPDINGLSLAKEIRHRDKKVVIIFVTNLVQYAVKGYEVNAMDYMVKPVSYDGFFLRMQKAISYLKLNTSQYILLNLPYSVMRIAIADIICIEVRGHNLLFRTEQGNIEIRGVLSDYEERLKNCGFIRCSRFALVNIYQIERVAENNVYFKNYSVAISKARNKAFVDELKKNLSDKAFTRIY